MATTIIPTSFKASNVTLSVPKAVEIEKDGKKQPVGKKSYVNYNGSKFTMQTATCMRIPFGLNVFDQSTPPKYSINLSFNGYKENPEVKAFFEAIQALDKLIVDEAVKNSKAWFGKEKSREVLEEFYTPSLKFGKKDDYPPTMKLNLRKLGDNFETKFYDLKGKPYKSMPIEELLAKNTQVTCLINCTDVWIAGNGKFNLRWNVDQIMIHKRPEKGDDFGFNMSTIATSTPVEDSDESVPARGGAGGSEVVSNHVDDDLSLKKKAGSKYDIESDEEDFKAPVKSSVLESVMPKAPAPADDDEDDGEDTEPIPAPKKPVIKKKPVVVKK
jgi:hypothetical protein